MTSSDYIKAYAMTRVGKGFGSYYSRTIEDNNTITYLSIHQHELVDKECYFVKQKYYKKRLNPKTKMLGVLGNAQFTFGIKNTTFPFLDLDAEEGLEL